PLTAVFSVGVAVYLTRRSLGPERLVDDRRAGGDDPPVNGRPVSEERLDRRTGLAPRIQGVVFLFLVKVPAPDKGEQRSRLHVDQGGPDFLRFVFQRYPFVAHFGPIGDGRGVEVGAFGRLVHGVIQLFVDGRIDVVAALLDLLDVFLKGGLILPLFAQLFVVQAVCLHQRLRRPFLNGHHAVGIAAVGVLFLFGQ